MAYGTSAGVLLYLGRSSADSSGFFSSANITLAITDADIFVDQINSSASSSVKTVASNMIAADILMNRYAKSLTNGLASTSNTDGEPANTYAERTIPTPAAVNLLKGIGQTPTWTYSTTTSRNANNDYLGPERPERTS